MPSWRCLRNVILLPVLAAGLGCALSKEETNEPPAELVDFDAKIKVKKIWSQSVGDSWENLRLGLVPVADGTNAYAAAHDGQVMCVTVDDGRVKWKVKTKLPLAAGPAVSGDTLVIGSSDGDVIALKTTDGSEVWRLKVNGEVLASPTVARGMVLVRTGNGRLMSLDLEDGKQLWSNEFELPKLTLRGNSPPVATGDLVVAGMDNGKVVALNVDNGNTIWESVVTIPSGRTDLELLADVDAGVKSIGERLFVVGYQGRVAMLSRDSGQILWANELSSYAGMGADWTRLYITDSRSEVIALDQGTGTTVWRHDGLRARWLTAPTSIGRNVVVGDFEGYLHWLNGDTGELVARSRVGKDALINSPTVSGDTLLVLSSGSELAAYQVIPPKVQ